MNTPTGMIVGFLILAATGAILFRLDRTDSHLLLAALVTGFQQRTKDVMRPMNPKRATEGESA
jgi:hypothetical protein